MRSLHIPAALLAVILAAGCAPDAPTAATVDPLAPEGPVLARGTDTHADLNRGLSAIRHATARFHDVDAAVAAGYQPAAECVSHPTEGVMGIHALNRALRSDPAIDLLQPEMLLYVPRADGSLKLVGVEYFVFVEDWERANGEGAERPTLLGQEFVYGTHGIPPHYELHVWVWSHNPSGMFAQWNPALSC